MVTPRASTTRETSCRSFCRTSDAVATTHATMMDAVTAKMLRPRSQPPPRM